MHLHPDLEAKPSIAASRSHKVIFKKKNEVNGFSFPFLMAALLQMDLNLVSGWQTKSKEFQSSEKDGGQHPKGARAGGSVTPVYWEFLNCNSKAVCWACSAAEDDTSPETFKIIQGVRTSSPH